MGKKSLEKEKQPQRPLTKNDFEAVLKAATKPVKKESDGKEPAKT